MTRTRFQHGLDQLKEKLLMMGGLAEQAVERAVEGYRRRDQKICQSVLTNEVEINRAEREIDELGLDLLAMQQQLPFADGLVIHNIAVGVLPDVRVAKPGLVATHFAISVLELNLAVAGGFHFGSAEDQASLDAVR